MPLILSQESVGKELFLWEISEEIKDFERIIPASLFIKIIESTKLEKRKLEKLSQVMLLKKAKIPFEEVKYHQNGKPYLDNGLHLSFSHSGDYSTLLVDHNRCGLDIEYQSDKILRIAPKFTHPSEKKLFTNDEYLYWIWSIKEAIFKYFGEGVVFRDHIEVKEIDEDKKRAFVKYDGLHGKGVFEMKLLRIKKYYLAYTKTYSIE